MDFFHHQDLARRNTRVLVGLFVLAVFALILITNALVAAFLFFGSETDLYGAAVYGWRGFLTYFSWQRFGMIGLGISATVALVVLFRWIQLSTGGRVVAESMGGQRLLPQTTDPAERRCLNVVDEMALAANMPVPAVYVLPDERGINAFAAGILPADAVVAVTRGAIDHLKRNELQGVIGHEFSHILNGDMRLNIRLAALLKGITFIGDVGYLMLRSRGHPSANDNRRGGVPALPVLGLGLCAVGWLGGLVADYIRAAISRQREFLADASAVQFSRDPDGIGDALKVIGGYVPGTLVHSARAAEMAHIFFGEVLHSLWLPFATHPPLDQRIRRLDPDWDGQFIKRTPRHYPNPASRNSAAAAGLDRAAVVAAAMAAAAEADEESEQEDAAADADFSANATDYEADTAQRESIPVALVRHSHEPLGAHAIVSALLVQPDTEIYQRQMQVLQDSGIRGLTELTHTLYPAVAELGAPRRLPLIELCLPALKAISEPQYRKFKRTLLQLIQADARTELHEWCLYQLVRHYLDPEFIQVQHSKPRYRRLTQVRESLQVVLSVLAEAGSADTAAAFAAGARELEIPDLSPLPAAQGSVAAFSKAVLQLADLYPLLKPRLLKAMALAAGEDGQLTPEEREIIAAMAAVMDCPAPELL
ncbi:peptidase M48 [Mangrovimicrobium sediminis]|uniref:Peptidase M48 n=1 Tax=Mangrovimicrobium sediminis TaxID=2562682 RepID=A0A4Z0M105_9GAMM|nr:M48 family metallopeptidase [Haliea sp. SAOS-164]TGD73126.1 peptidase M48 [Haliea sp. SAOS-164]